MNHLKALGVGLLLGLIVWATVGIVSCCQLDSSVRTGTIVAHNFTPAHTTWIWISHGSRGGGHLQPVFHPDRWSICLRGTAKNGEIRDVWLTVDQTTYHAIKDGSVYDRDNTTGGSGG